MNSYTFGLLQTNAYKGLKGHTASLLAQYKINTYQWALIGLLYDTGDGLSSTALAKELRVSKPFITKNTQTLMDAGWLEVLERPQPDMRVVIFTLTPQARKQVPEIEAYLKKEMSGILSGISKLQLLAYVTVLKHLAKKLDGTIDNSAYEYTVRK